MLSCLAISVAPLPSFSRKAPSFEVGDAERSARKGANKGGFDPQYISLSLQGVHRQRYQQNKTATKPRLTSTQDCTVQDDAISSCDC